ncbi:MAG: hypothetical protein RBG13Loki_2118 [Promethearchaeota archaeon CR_4]|nr:MAG: hypothetical protein RBG13Loki_2118 [Candidatus Lokiarchaeota archaeon CR_4]
MKFEKRSNYISDLYISQSKLTKKQYTDATELKDFIPTVNDDVTRLLQILLTLTNAIPFFFTRGFF